MIIILHYIFRLSWGAAIILSVIHLKLLWGGVAIILGSVVIPLLEMFIYAPFRKFLGNKEKLSGFISGITEFIATILIFMVIKSIFFPPQNFLVFLILLYLSNQLSRVFRSPDSGMDIFEFNSVLGFLASGSLFILLQRFF